VFPVGNVRVFHDRQVRVHIAWSAKAVAPLRNGYARTAAGTVGTGQIPGVESGLASCLHKKLRRQTRSRGSRNDRTLTAGSRGVERSNRHGINRPTNIVVRQIASFRKVNCRIREASAGKD